jgi:hypothetical protein
MKYILHSRIQIFFKLEVAALSPKTELMNFTEAGP